MSADLVLDETHCGPLCQHPSCWCSQRRIIRGTPHMTISTDTKSIDESSEDLPTQKIVNLLDDYGDDPRDKYPSKYCGRPTHDRDTRSRSARGESIPRVRAPNATPSSPLRPVHPEQIHTTDDKKGVAALEVREVFDLADLNSNWQETFQSRKYYVWVPNSKKNQKLEKRHIYHEYDHEFVSTSPALKVKDVTSQLVPERVKEEREAATLKKPWKHATSLWKSLPFYYPDCHCETPKPKFRQIPGKYHGVYELLDLPRDILSQILQHISERELLDRNKFTEALIRVLPQLEKNSTAISMAYSDVLQQYPVIFSDKKMGQSSYRSDLPKQPPIPQSEPKKKKDNVLSTRDKKDHHKTEGYNKKQPLPSIPLGKGEPTKAPPSSVEGTPETSPRKKGLQVPNISLGLPEIPSGARATKSFTYGRQAEKDFTLAPVVTPSMSPTSLKSTSGKSTPSHFVSASPVHVPTVSQEIDDNTRDGPPTDDRKPNEEPADVPQEDSALSLLVLASESKTQTTDSIMTIRVPRPPVNTPNVSIHEHSIVTTPVSGSLGIIQELNAPLRPDSEPYQYRVPLSRETASRSVRFNVETVDKVPHTPDPCFNEPAVLVNSKNEGTAFINSTEFSPPKRAVEVAPYNDDLVVIGQNPILQPTPPSRPRSQSRTGGITPEQAGASPIASLPSSGLDHSLAVTFDGGSEKSGLTSMMPRSSGTSRESSAYSDQVKRMWHEGKLPQSPAPPPPSPEPARDVPSEVHVISNQQTLPPTPATVRENAHIALLKEVAETDSEITLTARPPSNLDDISRINTPNSLASGPRMLMSRENSNVLRVDPMPELSEGRLTESQNLRPSPPKHVKAQNRDEKSPDKGNEIEVVKDAEGSDESPLNENKTDVNENTTNVIEGEVKMGNTLNVGGVPPQIDKDQLSSVSVNSDDEPSTIMQDGRVEYIATAEPTTAGENEDEHIDNEGTEELEENPEETSPQILGTSGAPPQIDDEGLDDDVGETRSHLATSHILPLHPGVGVGDKNQEEESLPRENIDPLDTFDVSDEALNDQLREELEKFKE